MIAYDYAPRLAARRAWRQRLHPGRIALALYLVGALATVLL